MPTVVELLRRNRYKLYVLAGVVVFSICLGTYYSVTGSDAEDGRLQQQVPLEDYTWDDVARVKAANHTKSNSTLVFATVVRFLFALAI